jgi:hypothetical protein
VPTPLAHDHNGEVVARLDELGEQSVELVSAHRRASFDAERVEHDAYAVRRERERERERELCDRLPLLKPAVDALQQLHVEHPAADLDRRVARC